MGDANWIEFDEANDVACSIRHAARAARFTDEDVFAWKWVMLALHAALQGACICHLTTSEPPFGALTKRNSAEWISYFEESRTNPDAKPPQTYLMALPELLRAIRKPNSAGDRSNDDGIAISNDELIWLERIHDDIRNQFTHFKPMGWSIDMSGVPELARLISRIIGEILDIGYAFPHTDCAWREQMRRDLTALELLGPSTLSGTENDAAGDGIGRGLADVAAGRVMQHDVVTAAARKIIEESKQAKG